jgi:carbon-monoxide dehydrogenase medium subunit
MKPAAFEYHCPDRLADALALLAELPNPKALAGGQSLMPMMNYRVLQPDHLIDLNNVRELAGISTDASVMRVGAMTRQCELKQSPLVHHRLPLVAEALEHVGHLQTRNRGTLGGSLCHADPSAELPTVCTALDATLIVERRGSQRQVSIHDWAMGYLMPAIEQDELLTQIQFKPWPPGHGWSFVEFARRHGDFAIVGVAALLDLDAKGRIERAAIAVGGCAEKPVRLAQAEERLMGGMPSQALFAEAGVLASRLEYVVTDAYVKESYRRHLADVLVRRALMRATERAMQGVPA